MVGSAGELWVRGVEVDWEGFDAGYGRRKVRLPTYPFERQRYWIEEVGASRETAGPAIGEPVGETQAAEWRYKIQWQASPRRAERLQTSSGHGSWLIYADRSALGPSLARLLEARGERCSLTFRQGARHPVPTGPGETAGAEALEGPLAEMLRADIPCRGVI